MDKLNIDNCKNNNLEMSLKKDYIEALSKGQITQEMCTQLLLNYDNQYIAFSDKICHNDMTKYYDLAE